MSLAEGMVTESNRRDNGPKLDERTLVTATATEP